MREDAPVKRSGSGICHDQISPRYDLTTNFTAFGDLIACLASGEGYRVSRSAMRNKMVHRPISCGYEAVYLEALPLSFSDSPIARLESSP